MKRWTGGLLGHKAETSSASVLGSAATRLRSIAAVALVGVLVGACSVSTSTTAPAVLGATDTPAAATLVPTPMSTPMVTPTASAQALAASFNATGIPTTLDPCQIVPASEASALAGTTFTAGVESVTSGNGKICTYGGQTLNVFEAIVGQAPDVATAQAGKAAAEAAINQQAGGALKFIELPGFADGAAYVIGSLTISGQTFNGSAFYALKGTTFFGFSDLALGHATPTLAAMQAEAQTILGRLP